MQQSTIPIANVRMGSEELEAALRVLESGQLIQGELVEALEHRFAEKVGARYAIAVSSGTAALHIAYLALLKPDDEVLVPAFTHISTASMACISGAVPVFCDIDPRFFTLNPMQVKDKITKKTRVIAPVHLFGNACDVETIASLARQYGLKVIWDAAQAHGTHFHGRDVGGFDHIVCYSFYPTKNMTTGEGGMLTTNDPDLNERCRLLRSHGQQTKYYHTMLGLNYRMTELAAAIGLEQLKKLDGFIEARRRNAASLESRLSKVDGVLPPLVPSGVRHAFHQYSILLDLAQLSCSRDDFAKTLRSDGIETAVHYPRPIHKQPVFAAAQDCLPVSERLSEQILSLPVHPALTEADLDRVAQSVQKAASRLTP